METMEIQSIVGDLQKSYLDSNKPILKERFSVPCSSKYIERFFERQVFARRHEYIVNDTLSESLSKVGQWLEDSHGTNGLLLAGNVGDGKTTTLYAIQEMIKCSRLLDPVVMKSDGTRDEAFLYIRSASELISFFTKDPDRYEFAKNCGLLAIDDFGAEAMDVIQYGNITAPLVELLYSRYRSQYLTIITTNLALKQIRPTYGPRLADRFNEMMTVVSFPEKSFRIKQF